MLWHQSHAPSTSQRVLGVGGKATILEPTDLQLFLTDYPLMRVKPIQADGVVVLRGNFLFSAMVEGGKVLSDDYELEISVPPRFPRSLPDVREIRGKIPDDQKHHVNPVIGTLCLGSPLRLLSILAEVPSLCGFAERCLLPFLYGVSHKRMYGGSFPFGELPHGDEGMLADYQDMLGLANTKQVLDTLRLLGKKKRVAHKSVCPCGCGLRLGKCAYRHRLNEMRKVAKNRWFRHHYSRLAGSYKTRWM